MPSEVLLAIITGASGLVGAVIGAGATLRQHSQQVRSERAKSIREQSELAARKCESLCSQIANDVTRIATLTDLNSPAAQARFERIDSAHSEVHAAALYLPEPLRGRIKEAAEIIYNAEDIWRAGKHYDSVGTVSRVVQDEVTAIVAAFLQHKDYHGTEPKMAEYRTALKNHDDETHYETPDDVDYRHRRENFYAKHPELRPLSNSES